MEKVERFYIGPQIDMPKIRSEARAGGVPTVAVAKVGNLVFTNGVVSTIPKPANMSLEISKCRRDKCLRI